VFKPEKKNLLGYIYNFVSW